MSCTDCPDTPAPPDAKVVLTVCGKTECRRDGVRGMVRLIKAGDRATDDQIIARRTACRSCDDLRMRGQRPICSLDGLALHWKTAVKSYECPCWTKGK